MTAEKKHRIWGWASFWYGLCGKCTKVTAAPNWQVAFNRLSEHVECEHAR